MPGNDHRPNSTGSSEDTRPWPSASPRCSGSASSTRSTLSSPLSTMRGGRAGGDRAASFRICPGRCAGGAGSTSPQHRTRVQGPKGRSRSTCRAVPGRGKTSGQGIRPGGRERCRVSGRQSAGAGATDPCNGNPRRPRRARYALLRRTHDHRPSSTASVTSTRTHPESLSVDTRSPTETPGTSRNPNVAGRALSVSP